MTDGSRRGHRLAARLTVMVLCPLVVLALLAAGAGAAVAAGTGPAGNDPQPGDCGGLPCIIVHKPGSPGSGSGGGPGSGSGGSGTRIGDGCTTAVLLDPQPPSSDPLWAGHTDGAIYQKVCNNWATGALGDLGLTYKTFWAADPPDPVPTVTPAQLAARALAAITLPTPVMHRSPGETNSDGGVPYTYVGLYTWFWTDPATFQPISRTAAVPGVWATLTVTPSLLSYTPSAGVQAAGCDGPGRAWTAADANTAPSSGGCAYKYRSASSRVTSTMTIHWDVTWVGATGGAPERGTMPAQTTQTSASFRVEQIQTVDR